METWIGPEWNSYGAQISSGWLIGERRALTAVQWLYPEIALQIDIE